MNRSAAAVFAGIPSKVEQRSFDIPELQSGEILVRVLASTVCGSDLHSLDCRRKVPTPTVLGHEIVGEIVAFGSPNPMADLASSALGIGDRVVWGVVAHCGQCFYCERDLPQKCERAIKYGHQPLRPGQELLGGFAEHCILVRGTSIVRLPDDLPLEVACPASCATATVAAVLHSVSKYDGRSILILGAGMLGLTACAMAKSRGCNDIVCVDIDPRRRELALKFGATYSTDPAGLAEIVDQVTQGKGVDYSLELSGANPSFVLAFESTRIGGTLVSAGAVFPSEPIDFVVERLTRRNLTIVGIHNYGPSDLVNAVEFLSANHHRFPFADLVAKWFPLTSIDDAFLAARDKSNIRVGVQN